MTCRSDQHSSQRDSGRVVCCGNPGMLCLCLCVCGSAGDVSHHCPRRVCLLREVRRCHAWLAAGRREIWPASSGGASLSVCLWSGRSVGVSSSAAAGEEEVSLLAWWEGGSTEHDYTIAAPRNGKRSETPRICVLDVYGNRWHGGNQSPAKRLLRY